MQEYNWRYSDLVFITLNNLGVRFISLNITASWYIFHVNYYHQFKMYSHLHQCTFSDVLFWFKRKMEAYVFIYEISNQQLRHDTFYLIYFIYPSCLERAICVTSQLHERLSSNMRINHQYFSIYWETPDKISNHLCMIDLPDKKLSLIKSFFA